MERMLTVGRLAEFLGLSREAVKSFVLRGSIKPTMRSPGARRCYFSREDAEKIKRQLSEG